MKRTGYLWTSVALLALLAIPGAAVADDGINWSYVEAGFNSFDIDELDDDGDGYFVGASFGGKNWHVLGWHGLLGEKADLVGELAYLNAEVGTIDDSGYFGRVGARWRPISLLEVGAFARWEDKGDLDDVPEFDNDVIWELNAMVYLWKFAIGLGYEMESEIDTYNAFARFNF